MWIDIAWGLQKFGIILENKVPPNLKHDFCKSFFLSKKVLVFFYQKETIFEIENWLWQYKIHQFKVAGVMSIHKIQ